MKRNFVIALFALSSVVSAQTVVIRQPGLVESLGMTAVGLVRGVGEFATGLVFGSTTTIQTTPGVVGCGTTTIVSQPLYPGVSAPIVTAPVVQPVVVPTPAVSYPVVVTPVYHQLLYYHSGYCPRWTCGPHGYPYYYHYRRW